MQTVPAPKIHAHTCLIPMRWGDMDAYRHVNNAVYFRYMEQACAEFIGGLGFHALATNQGPVVVNASCTFLRSLMYPGVVEVRMYCASPGRSSFFTLYEIRVQGDDLVYAEGQMKMVWIDRSTGKSLPLPDEFRAWFSR
ncbi:MAG: acyl-CoA thioesterase [Candidatus Accumulibacter sp.]|jgi:acyl-CoA thioester hydrolase|nr:acyl-CoA thioesterase [Accumulibacter sp.]